MDSAAAIPRLGVFRPGRALPCRYDRSRVRVGIVHIGLGAFARAHLAVYTDEVLALGHLEWGICGVSMLNSGVRDALEPQVGLYCLLERGTGAGRVIGSVVRCLVEPEDPAEVRRALLDPAVRIVTLTITESGYGPRAPAIQLLSDVLGMRRANGTAPFTVLCLDNISGTGSTLRAQVIETARSVDESLAAWIGDRVAFPRAMVDRMVPRTTEADRKLVRERFEVLDEWPVVAESFSQWVLEDDFPSGRPPWESAGATFVRDVGPWEAVKLRVLNAGHFAMACLGMLMGHGTVSEAAQNPELRGWLEGLLLDEVGPALSTPTDFDLEAYVGRALERFADPALGYRAAQTVSGGSLKLRARLVPSVAAAGARRTDRLALVFAAWIRIVSGPLADEISDPDLERIRSAASNGPANPASVAGRILAVENFFAALPTSGRFQARICELSESLARREQAPNCGRAGIQFLTDAIELQSSISLID